VNSTEQVAQWLERAAKDWIQGEPFLGNEDAQSMLLSSQDVFEQGGISQGLSRSVVELGRALSAWKRGEPATAGAHKLAEAATQFREAHRRIAAAKAVVDVPEELLF
jgi:hypothetical protein